MSGALVKRFARNTTGRDIIIGDIHGCFTKVDAALQSIGFDPDAGDRLFSVGDLVDRGPESHLSIEWLEKPWFHAIAGNHEDMAIRWPNGMMPTDNYIANGGGWNVANTMPERVKFSDAFSTLPIAIELETDSGLIGIVHAECPFPSWQDFTASLEDPATSKTMLGSIIDAAQWSRERISYGNGDIVAGVRAVVVGHTPMPNWTSLGNTIYIDTMGWRAGEFTLLDAGTLLPVRPA